MPFDIIAIGLGLSMDAAAVSITDGLCYPQMKAGKRFFIALTFGLLQGAMLLLGMLMGSVFGGILENIGGYAAFAVLLLIGLKMLYDGLKNKEEFREVERLSVAAVILQGLATSIDAAAAGLAAAVVLKDPALSAGIVTGITFLICLAGLYIGKKAGGKLEGKAVILGGVILIAIAVKILIETLIA